MRTITVQIDKCKLCPYVEYWPAPTSSYKRSTRNAARCSISMSSVDTSRISSNCPLWKEQNETR